MSKDKLLQRNKVIVILGPTSSGKSDVAIKLAKKFNGEIISADSRQIYRGLDIGTGKVPRDKKQDTRNKKLFISERIVHHLIDIINPGMEYSVVNFKKDAEKIIEDILSRGKLPIICGGTGFWIKAIVDNVNFPEVKPNKMLRSKLRNKSVETLFKMLKKLDLARAKNIDKKNPVRLIRAIEICKSIGKVPMIKCHPELDSGSNEIPDQVRNDKSWNFLQIGINIPKEKLQQNIKKRLAKRWQAGMIKEVEKLKNPPAGGGLNWKKIQSFGLAYFWIPLFLQKKISKEELFEKVYLAEKDYAKRQMTWFKRDKKIKWLPACRKGRKNYKEIEKNLVKFLA